MRNHKPDKIEKLKFSKEDQEFIDTTVAGKPSKKLIAYWTNRGRNIENHTKYFTAPQKKERLRALYTHFGIGLCMICREFPLYKLSWNLDGITLVQYYCKEHIDKKLISTSQT
jgi:hypothetical protein